MIGIEYSSLIADDFEFQGDKVVLQVLVRSLFVKCLNCSTLPTVSTFSSAKSRTQVEVIGEYDITANCLKDLKGKLSSHFR